ncbi:MAG: APC family permease [Actinomycetia bacterium]|nr:APC family permease [Actinomycetes bacterium]
MTTTTASAPARRTKPLGALRRFDMVLFSVAAIMLLTQVPITAKEGPAILFWTAVLLIFFFIPYGLMTAELGSTYADTGGIYSWVKRAFGGFWGTQVSWWYWINVGIWLPSVYLMFATLLGQTFDFTVGFWWTVGMAVALIWLNFAINVITLDTSRWVTNIAAIITVAIMLLIGVAGLVRVMTDGSATQWTSTDILPSWGSMVLLGVVVYNFLGFELMSSASEEMQDPKKDVPRSIFTAGVLIAVFYLVAIVGTLLLLPTDGFNRTNGLFRVLESGIGSSGIAGAVVVAISIGALYCFFAALVPWTIGANRAAAEAARRGDLPPVLGHTSKRFRTPVGAAAATALVGTFFTLGYGLVMEISTSPKIETLFWNLFAFSTLVFLLSYLVMAAAFLKLRYSDPEAPRPYRVPGGMVGAWITSTLVFGFISAAMVFFMWWPGASLTRAAYQNYVMQVGVGAALVLVLGVVLAMFAPRWRRRAEAAAEFEHPEATADVALAGIAPDDAATLHDSVTVDEPADANR